MPRQNHGNETHLRDAYTSLLRINQDVFADREYNVAYHALMAALHCAHSLNDIQGLVKIKSLADEQLKWIDANDPGYEHSSASAAARGHISVYKTLVTQSETRIQLIEYEANRALREE